MTYFIIGLFVSIGWYIGRFVVDIIGEVLYKRLKQTDVYKTAVKSVKKRSVKKDPIGFITSEGEA